MDQVGGLGWAQAPSGGKCRALRRWGQHRGHSWGHRTERAQSLLNEEGEG